MPQDVTHTHCDPGQALYIMSGPEDFHGKADAGSGAEDFHGKADAEPGP